MNEWRPRPFTRNSQCEVVIIYSVTWVKCIEALGERVAPSSSSLFLNDEATDAIYLGGRNGIPSSIPQRARIHFFQTKVSCLFLTCTSKNSQPFPLAVQSDLDLLDQFPTSFEPPSAVFPTRSPSLQLDLDLGLVVLQNASILPSKHRQV